APAHAVLVRELVALADALVPTGQRARPVARVHGVRPGEAGALGARGAGHLEEGVADVDERTRRVRDPDAEGDEIRASLDDRPEQVVRGGHDRALRVGAMTRT